MTQDKDLLNAAELTRLVLREQKVAFADQNAEQNLVQQVAEGTTHYIPLKFFPIRHPSCSCFQCALQLKSTNKPTNDNQSNPC